MCACAAGPSVISSRTMGRQMTPDRNEIDRALERQLDAWADWKGEQMEREEQERIARLFDEECEDED